MARDGSLPNQPELELGAGTLIITPTYNERSNLEAFVEATLGNAPHAHILIVDDNSPDGTGALADELAQRDGRVRVLHRPSKLGLGTAYNAAFQLGLREGYRFFFEMDADLSHDPKYLADFFRELEAGADVVIGSRNVTGGDIVGWGPGRHLLSKGGSLYSRLILGVAVRDLTSGYKAFRREALEAIFADRVESNGYSFRNRDDVSRVAARPKRARSADSIHRSASGRIQDGPQDRARSGNQSLAIALRNLAAAQEESLTPNRAQR